MEPFSRAEIRNWSAHNVPSFSKGPLFLWGKVRAFFSFFSDLSDSSKPGVISTDRNASCQSYLLQEKRGQTEQLFPAHTKAVPMKLSSVFLLSLVSASPLRLFYDRAETNPTTCNTNPVPLSIHLLKKQWSLYVLTPLCRDTNSDFR